jgi:hypothetical protein
MNMDNKYMKNDNIKIKNILKIPNAETFNENCSTYNFKSQKLNFEKFKNKIEKCSIVPTQLYAANWEAYSSARHSFLVLTSDPNLLWYRYDTNSIGAAQNWIYLKKKKIKLTDFLNMDEQDIVNYLK